MIIKITLVTYVFCLIPTLIAILNWDPHHRVWLESKLGSFFFFLSVWVAMPMALIYMALLKLTNIFKHAKDQLES